jgi:hypothetical protein
MILPLNRGAVDVCTYNTGYPPLMLQNNDRPGVGRDAALVGQGLHPLFCPYDPCMRMGFVVTFAVGLILALFGSIWALQGFGVLGGSRLMSNTTTWSIIGPITAVIGIGIAVFSWRKLSSK